MTAEEDTNATRDADLHEALRLHITPDHVQRARDSDALLKRYGMGRTYLGGNRTPVAGN
jgi:hypothetical protein